jgi:predicted ArsR family transcriptional regulator
MVDQIAALAALDEIARRRLYDAVRAAGRPLTREEAAQATGISRKLAAFHLDKLVAVGLLTTATKAGPRQVGRAPKAYEPVPDAVQVSVPPRAYADLASILLDAINEQRRDESVAASSQRVATARGEALGRLVSKRRRRRSQGLQGRLATVRAALTEAGYEPYDAPDLALRLRNCPFHPLAQGHPDFVCAVNGAFLAGLLEGAQADQFDVVAQTPQGHCCAEIRARVGDNDAHD